MKILLIEDNRKMVEMLKQIFFENKWRVFSTQEKYDSLEILYLEKPDLVIIDWLLPNTSGIEICKEIKKINNNIPIIMLTAKSTDEDEIEGFLSGVDEYIKKPFNPQILVLRIKSLLKLKDKGIIKIGKNIKVIPQEKQVFYKNKKVELSLKEYQIFYLLVENKNRFFTREEIIEYIWGFDFDGDSRTVDVHIRNIRKKLEQEIIKTKRGMGYSVVIE